MADDDLGLGTEDAPDKPAAPPTPAPDSSAVSAALKEGLGQLRGDLQQYTKEINQHVQRALEGRTSPVGRPADGPEDLTQALLQDPKSFVNKQAEEYVQSRLGPLLATQINDRYEDLKDKHRAKVDEVYGEGTFDTDILPSMEKLLERMSPDARGSSIHFQSVMRTIMGDEKMLASLMDKRAAEKQRKHDAPTGILVNGRRAPAQPKLDAESLSFMSDYERVTGVKLDAKQMEGLLDIRRTQGRWNTQNFPDIKNAKLDVAARNG